MEYRRFSNKIVLRLDKNDEVIESIKFVLNKENVKLSSISGIGATNDLTVGVFDTQKGKYNEYSMQDDFEIASLTGNSTTKDNEVYVHLHIVCAYSHGKTISGHLLMARISLTGEIFIDVIDGEISRKYSIDDGINKMNF